MAKMEVSLEQLGLFERQLRLEFLILVQLHSIRVDYDQDPQCFYLIDSPYAK
jgi:hypothetical protein